MARKKSAAKKAKEAALRAESENASTEEVAKPQEFSKKEDNQNESEDDESSSTSEEEDEYGELLTENVESSIQKVLSTLKSDPKKLLDPNAKFFDENDEEVSKKSKEKPLYLKDYHRQALLLGDYKKDENEFDTVDGEKPFVVTEREERNRLLDDIKNAFDGEEAEDDDEFLKKKEKPEAAESDPASELPDPTKNAEAFLSAFLDRKAWVPKENDKVIDLDKIDNDDEQEFDDAVEDFERAYNFRYEDPNSAEIVSYARNQATVRRAKTNARKKERERKHAEKEKEKAEREKALQKKKTEKLNKVADRLKKIKDAVGDDVSNEAIEKVFGESLLNDDFDDADWDNKMAQVFDAQYYGAEITKPEWDEDDEIMGEFHAAKAADGGDAEYSDIVGEDDEPETENGDVEAVGEKKSSKKAKLKEKKEAKKQLRNIREEAAKIVEANKLKILDEVEEERGRSKEKEEIKFKYREVSPETFGLSTREILLADDLDLNKFVSIKKFAPYRPKELALKDKRKFAKKKHLQQWRKDVFQSKEGPSRQPGEAENEIWIPQEVEERPRKKSKKTKR
uniref:Kri1-like C-terminal domain-containing protein n=1 Tax=Candidozyma auris TaxID=498019 RepID=A0A0L0NXU3_CANAR